MKRRDLVKISVAAVPGIAGADAGRLYGTPGSISNGVIAREVGNVSLPLSRAQLPPSAVSELTAYADTWSRALSDRNYLKQLLRSPEQAKQRLGLTREQGPHSNELATLLATWDPVIIKAIENRDYEAYLARLKRYLSDLGDGGGDGYMPPSRAREISETIQKQGLAMLEAYKTLDEKPEIPEISGGDELAYMAASVCGGPGVVVAAAVVVVVGALAVTYVSVGVNVTVGINVGVYLSVAVETAVTVSGAEMQAEPSGTEAIGDSILNSKVPEMSTQSYYELIGTAKLAAQAGHRNLRRLALKELFRREVDTAFKAAEGMELIHIHPDQRETVIDVASNYVLRTIGIDEHV